MKYVSIYDDTGEIWTGQAHDTSAAHKLAGQQLLEFYTEASINTADILARLDSQDPEFEMRIVYRHPQMCLTAIIRSEQAQIESRTFAEQMERS